MRRRGQGNNSSFEIACRIHYDVQLHARDLGTQILICLLLYEYLSSVSTISEATKHRGSLSALSASSSASETEYLVAEVGTSPTSVARAYHSRISAKKLSECMQMQNRIPMTL